MFAWTKLKHINNTVIIFYLTIRLARHLCSSTPLVIERAKWARYYEGWIMQNRVYVIYILYVWMDGWVCMLFKRAPHGKLFSKKDGFLGLTPVYSETTALSENACFSRNKKLIRPVLWHWRPFSRLNFKTSPFYGGYGVPVVGCQEPLVVRML